MYRTRAINHRGHYSKKKFWPIGCGYYSREATIQKKNAEQYLKGTPLHYAAEIGRFTQNKEKWISMNLH